jgi:tetratricopeptide (TPR) repeat protein
MSFRIAGIFCLLLAASTAQLRGQAGGKDTLAVVEGMVRDSQDHPIAAAVVSLERTNSSRTLVATSDAQGRFRFEGVPVGSYTVHAKLPSYDECREGPFVLHERETKSIVLLLTKEQIPALAKESSSVLEFADEPTFTVAGVTDTTAMGGHGSGTAVRSSNALSKDAVALGREEAAVRSEVSRNSAKEEAVIRAKLAREDSADLHAQLAEIEENEGRPLEAVQEYQRAAEMQPTEPHLFAWGAELLLHHAPEPAILVFSKGRRLYPHSSRMLIGLGAARYAQRSEEQAGKLFLEACDLDPSDPTPYLFLGRLQQTVKVEPPGWTERMKRFVGLHPESPMAHYLYGVALMKRNGSAENFNAAERELKTAIELDAHLGSAYLQLGILHAEHEDLTGAIAALQKAIETTPLPDEAHYHLAQVYRRMGEAGKANKEIEQFKQISEEKSKQAERERHEIPQFVYTLRNQKPPSQPSHP